jgi:hypothetical protein
MRAVSLSTARNGNARPQERLKNYYVKGADGSGWEAVAELTTAAADDLSPPRRRARHDSPQDLSPPRRGGGADLSPPRRPSAAAAGRAPGADLSPPRRGTEETYVLKPRDRSPSNSSRSRKGCFHAQACTRKPVLSFSATVSYGFVRDRNKALWGQTMYLSTPKISVKPLKKAWRGAATCAQTLPASFHSCCVGCGCQAHGTTHRTAICLHRGGRRRAERSHRAATRQTCRPLVDEVLATTRPTATFHLPGGAVRGTTRPMVAACRLHAAPRSHPRPGDRPRPMSLSRPIVS